MLVDDRWIYEWDNDISPNASSILVAPRQWLTVLQFPSHRSCGNAARSTTERFLRVSCHHCFLTRGSSKLKTWHASISCNDPRCRMAKNDITIGKSERSHDDSATISRGSFSYQVCDGSLQAHWKPDDGHSTVRSCFLAWTMYGNCHAKNGKILQGVTKNPASVSFWVGPIKNYKMVSMAPEVSPAQPSQGWMANETQAICGPKEDRKEMNSCSRDWNIKTSVIWLWRAMILFDYPFWGQVQPKKWRSAKCQSVQLKSFGSNTWVFSTMAVLMFALQSSYISDMVTPALFRLTLTAEEKKISKKNPLEMIRKWSEYLLLPKKVLPTWQLKQQMSGSRV